MQSRKWVFTLNNPDIEGDTFMERLKAHPMKAILFQKEVGESGTPHFQGCFTLTSPQRFKTVVKYVDRWHLEQCKSWDDSLVYCSKATGRIGGPWAFGCDVPEEDYTFKLDVLRPWQEEVIKIINEVPDDRSIHWFYDAVGGKGKTCLAKHICFNHKPCIYVQGKSADIKSAIAVLKVKPRIVLFGLPRSLEEFVSYEAIESCKDGIFFSGKYESGMVLMKPPHVIIFANFMPDTSKLSADRWIIHNLTDPIVFASEALSMDAEYGGGGVAGAGRAPGIEMTVASGVSWESI